MSNIADRFVLAVVEAIHVDRKSSAGVIVRSIASVGVRSWHLVSLRQ
ncbi:hypothetical protein [Rhodopseudomonas sp. BAL398]|nr:hypothetical protein [Rhodopseudomonas sp. BAL398]